MSQTPPPQPIDLVVHHGALGDWIVVLPLIRAMALERKVVAVTNWSKAQLAADLVPNVEAMDIELREFTRLFSPDGPAALGPYLEQTLTSAARIVSFVSNGNDAWADNVRRLAPQAKIAFAFPRPPEDPNDWSDHVHAWHRSQLAKQGLEIPDAIAPDHQTNPITNPTTKAVALNPTGPIVIHPGSGGVHKCWPPERYVMLADALTKRGHTVTALLGEVELTRWPSQRITQWQDHLRAKSCTTLESLHAALKSASCFIGNDAGPAHLAAQLGIPTLALFGPTLPQVWAPLGPRVSTLAPPTPNAMTWLDMETVLQTVEKSLLAQQPH